MLHLSGFSGIIMRRSPVGGDMTSPIAPVETQKLWGGYKLLAGIAVIMGAAMVLVILFSHRGFYNVYRFRQEWHRLEQENARLAAENDHLTRTIDRLQHDPEYIQDRIRQELNFVKKNEVIFQFPPDKPGVSSHLIPPINGATPPQAKAPALSTRQAGTAKLASEPSEDSSKKKAKRRRD